MSKKLAALFLTLFLLAGFAVYAEETLCIAVLPETPLINYLPSENDQATLYAESIYDYLYTQLRSLAQEINISSYNLTLAEFKDAYSTTLCMHPDLFFCENFAYFPSETILTSVFPRYSTTDKTEIEAKAAKIEAVMDELSEGFDELAFESEILLLIHDRLALYAAYDTELKNYGADDLFLEGKAVCQGYANAFYALASRAGIPVGFVSSEKIKHIWNAVCINDKWYHVDVTWDDPVADRFGNVRHDYFLKSNDALLELDPDRDDFTPLENNSTEYDGAYWNDACSQIYFNGFYRYYISSSTRRLSLTATLLIKSDTVVQIGYDWTNGMRPLLGGRVLRIFASQRTVLL